MTATKETCSVMLKNHTLTHTVASSSCHPRTPDPPSDEEEFFREHTWSQTVMRGHRCGDDGGEGGGVMIVMAEKNTVFTKSKLHSQSYTVTP